MDRAGLCKQHLAMAQRHVGRARRIVERQREVVVVLARAGHATDKAIGLLRLFEQVLELHLQERDWLRAQLALLRQASSSRLSSGWSRDTQR